MVRTTLFGKRDSSQYNVDIFADQILSLCQAHHDVNMTYEQSSAVQITFTCSWGGGSLEDFQKPPRMTADGDDDAMAVIMMVMMVL